MVDRTIGKSDRHGFRTETVRHPDAALFAGQCRPWRPSFHPDGLRKSSAILLVGAIEMGRISN